MAGQLVKSLFKILGSNAARKRRTPKGTRLAIEACEQRLLLSAAAVVPAAHHASHSTGTEHERGLGIVSGFPASTLLELSQWLLTTEGLKGKDTTFSFSSTGKFGTKFDLSGSITGATATETITMTMPGGQKWVETGTITLGATVTDTIKITSPTGQVINETGTFTFSATSPVHLTGSVTVTAPNGKTLTGTVTGTVDPIKKTETTVTTTSKGKAFTVTTAVVTTSKGQTLYITSSGPHGHSKHLNFPLPANPLT
jgi:hypothetical protein